MKLLAWLFNLRKKPARPVPIVGQTWELDSDNPFHKDVRVIILETRQGYLRYQFLDDADSQMCGINWTLPMTRFTSIYRPAQESK